MGKSHRQPTLNFPFLLIVVAQRVQQLHPDLKMTKITKPVPINVANEDAALQGIAKMFLSLVALENYLCIPCWLYPN